MPSYNLTVMAHSIFDFTTRGKALIWALAASTASFPLVLSCAQAAIVLLDAEQTAAAALWCLLCAIHAYIGASFALRAIADTDFAFDKVGLMASIFTAFCFGLVAAISVSLLWSSVSILDFAVDVVMQVKLGAVFLVLLAAQQFLLSALPPPPRLYLGHR